MKVVLVTQRLLENETYPETRECLDVRWGGFFRRLDLVPIPLPVEQDPALYLDRFAPAGIVLTGGNDLAGIAKSALSAKRDAFELALLAGAVARKVPVFAVCRGMQLLASHHGASVEKVTGHTGGASHILVVAAASRNGALLGDLRSVRTYHDYGIRRVPAGFREVARSPDGVIEAMEHESLPVYCQMWHPEREDQLTPGEDAVIRALFSKKETER